MPLITDQSTLFSFTNSVKYTGQTTGSFGNQDLTNIVLPNSYGQFSIMNSLNKVTTLFNTYFKMEGYNPITQQYENWHSMGTALMNPPSGNALTNISVIATWQDR